MERSYLIRYGLMAQVGRFTAGEGSVYERGETVVIRSHRGTELGEVLIEAPPGAPAEASTVDGLARVLRAADAADLERARRAEADRLGRFEACRRVLEETPRAAELDLIDVEPLLDDHRTVIHFLGRRFDVADLLAAFREATDLDVMFQSVGRDEPEDSGSDTAHGCGSCASAGGGCGSGGCGSTPTACDDCGVRKLLAARR
jgi:cell fate regulator YaaT (PSP1 superfamily)